MARFSYKAKQGPQNIVEGILEADNVDAAVAKILKTGLTPLEVKGAKEEKAKPGHHRSVKTPFSFSRRLSSSDFSFLTRQIADLVDAGVPMLRTLALVEHQTQHPFAKEIVGYLLNFVKDG